MGAVRGGLGAGKAGVEREADGGYFGAAKGVWD